MGPHGLIMRHGKYRGEVGPVSGKLFASRLRRWHITPIRRAKQRTKEGKGHLFKCDDCLSARAQQTRLPIATCGEESGKTLWGPAEGWLVPLPIMCRQFCTRGYRLFRHQDSENHSRNKERKCSRQYPSSKHNNLIAGRRGEAFSTDEIVAHRWQAMA